MRRSYLWHFALFTGLTMLFPAYLMLRDPTPVDGFLVVLATFFTMGMAVGTVYNLGYALGWVEADEEGMRNCRVWSNQFLAWDEIKSVKVTTYRGDGSRLTVVRAYPHSGRAVVLVAPRTNRIASEDESFQQAVSDLARYTPVIVDPD
jgi:hypothetical protein